MRICAMNTFNMTIVFRIKDKATFEVPLCDEIIIGSDNSSDFLIPNIAKQQCKITCEGDNVYIQNLSEDYKAILDGRVLSSEKTTLDNGILIIGNISFEVEVRILTLGKKVKLCSKCDYINGDNATICRKCGYAIEFVPVSELMESNNISRTTENVGQNSKIIDTSIQNLSENKLIKIFSKYKYQAIGIAVGVVILIGVIIGIATNHSNKSENVELEIQTTGYVQETSVEIDDTVEIIDLNNVTISPIENQLYTGAPVYCSFEVRSGDTVLVEGTDYSCAYENNTGVGTATVYINGNDVTTTGSIASTFAIITGDSICDDENNRGVLDFVVRLYTGALNRFPEPNILISYVNQLVNQELSGSDLVNVVYNSEEFVNRNLSNEEYLISVYRSVLNREPDEGGFNSNLTLLDGEMSRNDLVNIIIGATEFEGICDSIGIINQTEQISPEDIILPDGQYYVRMDLSQFFGTNDYSSLSFALLEYYTFTSDDINNLHPGDIVNLRGWNEMEDEIVVSDHYSASDSHPELTSEDNLYYLVPNSNSSLWFLSTYDDYSICRNIGNYTLPVSNSVIIDDTVYTYYNNMNYSDNSPHIVNSFENTTLNAEVLGDVTGVSDAANGWISALNGTITVRNNHIVSATLYQRIMHTFD
ncbi:MAG: DUF4214 domain-containing protein [Saccharofermentans sp.]|nr:DUF4214 domain-containing protein [Saccharofermentans sp.]